MSAKHTPGPWEVHAPNPGCGSSRIFAGTRFIGNIGNSDNADGGDSANANLISAAPELLAACEEYMSIMHYPEPMDIEDMKNWQRAHIQRVLAAIAKAKGGAA